MSWFNIGRIFDVRHSPPSVPVHGTTSLVPGQMVACVDDGWCQPSDWWGNPVPSFGTNPAKGCVYIVRDVTPAFGRMFVSLAEFRDDRWFGAWHFRPVRPTSIEIFRDQMVPTDGVRDTERVS